jgi:hypothetical protein
MIIEEEPVVRQYFPVALLFDIFDAPVLMLGSISIETLHFITDFGA